MAFEHTKVLPDVKVKESKVAQAARGLAQYKGTVISGRRGVVEANK